MVVLISSKGNITDAWIGPYRVIKKVSDVTDHIQHLYDKRQRKVIHSDRLKPSSREVIQSLQNSGPIPAEQISDQRAYYTSQNTLRSKLELL